MCAAQATEKEVQDAMRRRIVVVLALVVVTVGLALSPAFAQGGCQAFGVAGVADTAHSGDMGGYATTFAPGDMDDVIHDSQVQLCGS